MFVEAIFWHWRLSLVEDPEEEEIKGVNHPAHVSEKRVNSVTVIKLDCKDPLLTKTGNWLTTPLQKAITTFISHFNQISMLLDEIYPPYKYTWYMYMYVTNPISNPKAGVTYFPDKTMIMWMEPKMQ